MFGVPAVPPLRVGFVPVTTEPSPVVMLDTTTPVADMFCGVRSMESIYGSACELDSSAMFDTVHGMEPLTYTVFPLLVDGVTLK